MKYLIPRNVITRFQFFSNFGWFELFIVATFAGLGILAFKLLGLFNTSLIIRICPFIIFTGFSYLAVTSRITGNDVLLTVLLQAIKFSKKTKRYLYSVR